MSWIPDQNSIQGYLQWRAADTLLAAVWIVVTGAAAWLFRKKPYAAMALAGACASAILLVAVHVGLVYLASTSPSPLASPLSDDAVKWQLASHLYDDFQAVKGGPCHAVMVHNDSDYAENLFNDLQKILVLAGCSTSEQQRDYTLPKGISVCTARTVPAQFAQSLVTRLDDTAHTKADYEFYDTPDIKCPTFACPIGQACFAVTIGNKPE
jgi:hypothetical protein